MGGLPLGVLRCLARPLQTGFLSLFDPGISGHQPVLAQHRPMALIGFYQSAGNTMRDGAALPGYATTSYLDHDTVLIQGLGKN